MKKRHIPIIKLLLFFSILTFFACKSKNKTTSLRGEFFNASGDTLYFSKLLYDRIEKTDTIILDNEGKFEIEIFEDSCEFFALVKNDYNFIRMLIDKGEQVIIKADINNLPASSAIEGSEGSSLLQTIERRVAEANKVVDSLQNIVNLKKNDPDFPQIFPSLDSAFYKNLDEVGASLKSIIQNNMTSLASIVAIYQVVANQSVFNEQDHADLFIQLNDSIFSVYPTNSFALNLKKYVGEILNRRKEKERIEKTLQPGLLAPDFSIPDITNRLVSLSGLRGKYVLLKFWDSHCQICQRENPELLKIYNKFRNKGFEVLAISIDTEKADLINYLSTNNLPWIHAWVFDAKNQENELSLFQKYYLEIIPIAHLIDKEGRFIEVNIKNEELQIKLEQLLN
ncbi:MAG: TlpA disulfide reductase family protein [Bacteroidales bacterium]|nr:TlpA disulfide reductase family protein [Bacteroidales bacterium]